MVKLWSDWMRVTVAKNNRPDEARYGTRRQGGRESRCTTGVKHGSERVKSTKQPLGTSHWIKNI
jgi:hypothetical protein